MQMLFFISALLKCSSDTRSLIPSQLRSITSSLSLWLILSGCIFTGLTCLICHQRKHF